MTTIINTATFGGPILSTTLFPTIALKTGIDITYLKGLDFHVQWSSPIHNGYIALDPTSEVTVDLGQTDNTIIMQGTVKLVNNADAGNVKAGDIIKITANTAGFPFFSKWRVDNLTNGATMSGNLSSMSVQYFDVITPSPPPPDTTAPTITINTPVLGTRFDAGAAFTISGSASDTGGSGLKQVQISIDGGTAITANGTATWTASLVVPVSGTLHTITATATDNAGNSSSATLHLNQVTVYAVSS